MSRLHDELQKRTQTPRPRTEAESASIKRREEKLSRLGALYKSKDFQVYLQIEEEMNDPKIVVAYNCTDPVCMSLKHKIRDFGNRKRLLDVAKGQTNGVRPRS